MPEILICIQWTGPYSLAQINTMNGPTDKGLYQVYAHHPVYGRCLVYIGQTCTNFAERIPTHEWGTGSENDPERVEYYVGRLIGETPPKAEEWYRQISLAEMLLIHAHAPAYNSQYIREPPIPEECGHVRVLNFGAVRSLHREVSGLVWTARAIPRRGLPAYGA